MAALPLSEVIGLVEGEGARLRAEFYRADGPRGRRGSCPIDVEIEQELRRKLCALIDCAFVGEETGSGTGPVPGMTWLVDPHDGTAEFSAGRRGSAISVALLREGKPVLGVVHAPDPPDRGPDTIAWAEGARLQRNGRPLTVDLSQRKLERGEFVLATAKTVQRPETWARAVAPAHFVPLPSIAYRLARVAAGDAVATASMHGVSEYDVAAGLGLVIAAGGIMLDAAGREVRLQGTAGSRLSGCFAGAPQAAQQLARVDWKRLEDEPRREPRVVLGFPRIFLDQKLAHAQGAMLGQVIGDSLGARVEAKPANEIARLFPQGVRELSDGGGVYHLMAGQPTDDSEMALTLARAIARDGRYEAPNVLEAYRRWLTSRPVDVGMTTERGLIGASDPRSESNGSLMRCSPIGVWAVGDPALAARAARDDSGLTHPNDICVEACAAYCAAIAAGVAGASREEMVEAAVQHSKGPARDAVKRGAGGARPADFFTHPGWVVVALQNAFFCMMKMDFEEALVSTVGQGGDTDTNAAIAGALLGAAHGREAIPPRWVFAVLSCRPLAEAGALRPRPTEYWPDDVLDLSETLLLAGRSAAVQ